MPEKKVNFTNALNLLKKNAEQRSYGVWVPSLGRDVNFKPLSTLHHKKFVKILIDANTFNLALNLHIYDVIKECCLENINIGDLNIFDKIAICYGIRKHNFKKPLSLSIDDDATREIIIDDLFNNFKEKYSVITSDNITVGDIVIKMSLPTLKREREFDKYIQNRYLNIDKSNEKINQVVADLMLYGVIIYIDSIQIGEESVSFDELQTEQKIELIGNLDASIFNRLNEYIEKCNNKKTELCSFEIIDKEDKVQTIEVVIDAGFFMDE